MTDELTTDPGVSGDARATGDDRLTADPADAGLTGDARVTDDDRLTADP